MNPCYMGALFGVPAVLLGVGAAAAASAIGDAVTDDKEAVAKGMFVSFLVGMGVPVAALIGLTITRCRRAALQERLLRRP
jgi:hypothetical protein